MMRRVVVPDDPAWSTAVMNLFSMCTLSPTGMEAVQTDTFFLRPYAPVRCTCGHEADEARWIARHQHHSSCAIFVVQTTPLSEDPLALRTLRRKVCADFGLEQLQCTCGRDEALEQWRTSHPHALHCHCGPNFYFAPRNYALWWCEEPLRGAWATHPLTSREFLRIFEQCVQAL